MCADSEDSRFTGKSFSFLGYAYPTAYTQRKHDLSVLYTLFKRLHFIVRYPVSKAYFYQYLKFFSGLLGIWVTFLYRLLSNISNHIGLAIYTYVNERLIKESLNKINDCLINQ